MLKKQCTSCKKWKGHRAFPSSNTKGRGRKLPWCLTCTESKSTKAATRRKRYSGSKAVSTVHSSYEPDRNEKADLQWHREQERKQALMRER